MGEYPLDSFRLGHLKFQRQVIQGIRSDWKLEDQFTPCRRDNPLSRATGSMQRDLTRNSGGVYQTNT